MKSKDGLVIILSAPSGCGKDTIISKAMEKDGTLKYAISSTTRKPREGEIDGVHYIFKTMGEF